MGNDESKLVGILGTVIIHLIAGIIFILFQFHTLKKDYSKEFKVEVAVLEESPSNENKIKLPVNPVRTVEKVLKGDDEMLNIARNLANKTEEKINAADYINKVKEELIQSGKLGKDNYIDEQKRVNEMTDEGITDFENRPKLTSTEPKKPKESLEMAANYKGPTRIYYDLMGRNHTYLPIPIYKCQGSGVVVLSIEVNQQGIVESAKIIENESTVTDDCLVETAVNTALISRFNPDINTPRLQRGTLTYQFVAQ
jgi:hypothetical protein